MPLTVPQCCDSRGSTWGGAEASGRGGSWGELGEPGSGAVFLSELPGEVQHSGWHAGSRNLGYTSSPRSQVTRHLQPEILQDFCRFSVRNIGCVIFFRIGSRLNTRQQLCMCLQDALVKWPCSNLSGMCVLHFQYRVHVVCFWHSSGTKLQIHLL